jgi:hypothetical protein
MIERSPIVAVGPTLTGRRYPVDYLTKFLTNPAATRGYAPDQLGGMPNLELRPHEITSLVAFINTEAGGRRYGFGAADFPTRGLAP